MPADTSLGDAMSSLGQSLAQAMNPLNQIRAQDMLAQMRQRQWEIQQKQALDAANANAAEVYRRANPHGLNDADLAATVAGIRAGTYNPTATIEALKAAGGLQAAQAAAALVDAQHPEWSPAQRASAKAQIISGKSLSEVEQSFANAAKDTNAATATIAGTNAATTPAGKEAAAIGQPETGVKLDTQERLRTAPVISGPLTPETRAKIDQQTIERGIAGLPVTADAPVSSGVAAPLAAERVGATTTGTNTADNATKPRGNVYPPPGGFGSTPPPAQPSAPVTVQTVGNPSAPYAVPTPVSRTLPDGSVLMGPTDAEKAANDATNKGRADQLNQAVDGWQRPRRRMKTKLGQIRDLEAVASTSGAGGQVETAVIKRLADAGIVVGDQASAYKAIDQILNTEIPDIAKSLGNSAYLPDLN